MKKKGIIIGVCSFVILLSVVGILYASNGTQLKNYNKEEVKSASINVIDNLNNRNYEAITNNFREDLKVALPKDKIAEAWGPIYDSIGKYEGIEKINFREKDGYAIASVLCNYEKGRVLFTLSFD